MATMTSSKLKAHAAPQRSPLRQTVLMGENSPGSGLGFTFLRFSPFCMAQSADALENFSSGPVLSPKKRWRNSQVPWA
jgi:hypothetical protein